MCARLVGMSAHRVLAHAFPEATRGERKISPMRRGKGAKVRNPMVVDQVIRISRPNLRRGRRGRGRDGGGRRRSSLFPDTPARHGIEVGEEEGVV